MCQRLPVRLVQPVQVAPASASLVRGSAPAGLAFAPAPSKLRQSRAPEQIQNDESYAILNTLVPRLFPIEMYVRLLGCRFRRAGSGVHAPVVEQALAGCGSFEQRLNAGQQCDGCDFRCAVR